jgi:hypothetical protein
VQPISDYLQYGALGVLALALIGMFALAVKVLSAFARNTEVLAQTAEVLRSFKENTAASISEVKEIVGEVKDFLLSGEWKKGN